MGGWHNHNQLFQHKFLEFTYIDNLVKKNQVEVSRKKLNR